MTVLATMNRTAVQNRASVLAWFRGVLAGAAGLLALAAAPTAPGATLPPGFAETRVTDGLGSSTAMAFTPDGRILVTDQDGRLLVVKNGVLLSQPFVTLNVDAGGERGLLGVAIDPAFATNRWIYLYYTARSPSTHNRVSRFTANGDVAAAGSEVAILDLPALSSSRIHNGGAIHFGPDGRLYVATGDNGKSTNSQSMTTTLGKILRINKDGSIPTDNPFYGSTTGLNRAIWALGLRNPFTFSFQPGPGRMFINDVGAQQWEEINDGIAGSNYGWPETEGPSSDPRFRAPIFAYPHGSGSTSGCAITGGTFYNPPNPQFPAAYVGDYLFSDYCNAWIRRLDTGPGFPVVDFAGGTRDAVDLVVGTDGALYYLARFGPTGQIYRVTYTGSHAPTITTHPASQTVSVGSPATFGATASGSEPLAYQWQRNGSNIAGATAASYTIPSVQASDNGARFRVRVTNAAGSATSNEAVLTVTTNRAPTATITTPAAGSTYGGGQTIAYSGTATDPEDGNLGGARFTWRVDFHHADHIHPFSPSAGGSTGGSFVAATTGHTEANVWYRIHLTVTDSGGLTSSTFRDVTPRTVSLTLATAPTGLQLRLDGQPVTAPVTFTGVAGVERALDAPSPQGSLLFRSWSNGGAQTQTISTPGTSTTYTATYGSQPPPFRANVNFQPASAQVPSGYLVDSGAVYGPRGNGHVYGWTTATSAFEDRNSSKSPDQRYDTLVMTQHRSSPNATWELGVPNGTYTVRIVAGDPSSHNSVYRVAAEGLLVVDGTPSATSRWVEGTRTVTVADGRLTITSASGASNNKLCFLEVASA
jgi:glucose/arabinose dehydrogenase